MTSDKRSLVSDDGMEIELQQPGSTAEDTVIIEVKAESSSPQSVYIYTWTKVSNISRDLLETLRGMKLEVVMFAYTFSYIMRSVSSTNMIIDKVCRVHLGYPEDVCRNLKLNKMVKDEVDRISNNYQLGHSLTQLVPSALLSLFIGPWSDRYGRKVPIIVALLGIVLDGLGSTLCAHYMESRVEFYFIPAVFIGVSGGFISLLTVLYSYSSDTTVRAKRTLKYAFLELAFGLGAPLGSLAGGWLYKWSGYVEVFLTSTGGNLFAFLWVVFVLEETKGLDCKHNWREKFRNFWSTDAVISSFRATFKNRPNKGKQQIIGLIVAMSIIVFGFASAASVGFFYVHNRYDWDNTTYSTVASIFSVMSLVVMMVVVPVSRRFKVSDPVLGLAGSVSDMLKFVFVGFSFDSGFYFLGSFLGLLHPLGTLAGRSRISKVASKKDLGKIFSFLTTAETILPILAIAVVSQIFNATLSFFPGLLFLLMAVLFVVPVAIFVWISRLPAVDYDQEVDEEPDPPEGSSNTDPERS